MAAVGDVLKAPESGWKRYDDTDSSITYTGTWMKTSGESIFYNGTQTYSIVSGNKITFNFTGTGLRIIGVVGSDRTRTAKISIDGVDKGVLNSTSTSTTLRQAILFEAMGLSNTTHTVVITTQDTNPINFDAYDVYSPVYKILLSSPHDNVVRSANMEKCMHLIPNSNVQFNDKVFSARATPQSVLFKFKCDAIPSTSYYIFMHNATGSAVWVTVNSPTGHLSISSYSDSSSYVSINLSTNSPLLNICDGKWHTIVYTWDGTKNTNGAKVYIDNMNTPYTTQTVTYTRSIETSGNLYFNLAGYGDFYLKDFASLTRVATTQELLNFQNDKLSLTTSGLNAYFKFQDSINGVVENLVAGTTIRGITDGVESIRPKVIRLGNTVDEDSYFKYGLNNGIAFNESFAGVYDVKKTSNTVGSGKTYEHTIDLSKRKVNKIIFN